MNNTLFWKSALVFALVMIGFAKWQTSDMVKSEYDDICISNYNKTESYYTCMSTFEKQSGYYNFIFYSMVGLEVVSIGFLLKNYLGKKSTVLATKKKKVRKS
jgi:hypothetical protein